MKPILIIMTGHAPGIIRACHGDFPRWFQVSGSLNRPLQIIDVTAGEKLPSPQSVAGGIITGSKAMITERATWSERTAGWVRHAMDRAMPLFGVCFGHQLMAHALGGRVDYLPGGREIGTLPVRIRSRALDNGLLAGLPSRFLAHTIHEQSVLEIPPTARVMAGSSRDPNHLLYYGCHASSVQFHPEFTTDVMRAYIRYKHDVMRLEGHDPHQMLKAVAPTPYTRHLLWRFAHLNHWYVNERPVTQVNPV